jgi:hypothetical protein
LGSFPSNKKDIMAAGFIRQTKPPDNQQQLSERVSPLPSVGRFMREGFIRHLAGHPGRPERGTDDDNNYNPDGTRKDGHGRKPRYKSELLCRSYAGDVGIRPIPQTSNIVFWESPDIWIEGPSGNPDLASPGVLNQVKVQVWNLGLATCYNACVDLVSCYPSVGTNAAGVTPIGQKVIPLLAAGQHTIESFDWTPTEVNGGHECLFAHVYEPVSDAVVAPFNPVADRHVGLHNIDLIRAVKGQKIDFPFFELNFTMFSISTTVELQRLEGEAMMTFALTLGRQPWAPASAVDVALTLPRVVNLPLPPHARLLASREVFRETLQEQPGPSETRHVMGVLQGLLAQRKGPREPQQGEEFEEVHLEPSQTRAEAPVVDVRLPPRQHVQMSLQTTVPMTASPGSADVYRIIERTGGRISGGITVIVETK